MNTLNKLFAFAVFSVLFTLGATSAFADSPEDFRYCACDGSYDVQLYNRGVLLGKLGDYGNPEECMRYLERNPSCKVVTELHFEQAPEFPLTYCACDSNYDVILYVDSDAVRTVGYYDNAEQCINALAKNPACDSRLRVH
ncbi:MAG: hypothetical protein AB7T49_10980 [Oligoflexales bacterium]